MNCFFPADPMVNVSPRELLNRYAAPAEARALALVEQLARRQVRIVRQSLEPQAAGVLIASSRVPLKDDGRVPKFVRRRVRGRKRIGNITTPGAAGTHAGPRPRDITSQTRTRNDAGADATVHISDLLAGRASRRG